ncbi:sulfite exporter TauE/SafE family protein [Flaviflexus equikiangi]|uniref:Probable membrane transporter protein n=1 Tax=Flaviflexus equikiangi TaxID=2758573 RepID=A0ABS2TDR8_9ACTO|nr:sulfite exporter TauE/SafE family protein [Flaviflexus equikiangi]MBM9432803.1 sulfite exporter TauE/SafE family protein [Flaviflexus equikiangi]
MDPIVLALLLAALVGVSLGLLGGGGSILTVPILTYVVGMEPREAIASSLFIVGATSAVSAIGHAKAGRVRWRTGLIFGGAGMAGAFAGGLLGGLIPGAVLMVLFALMMIVTATAMIRGRSNTSDAPARTASATRVVIDGFAVGIATGLVGAGGGFLIVPALNLLGGLPMAVAVGTSLLVITMKSFAGLGGYLLSVSLDWPLLAAFTGTAIAASFLGVSLAGRLPERALRTGFGIFVLIMGVFVLAQELPALFTS